MQKQSHRGSMDGTDDRAILLRAMFTAVGPAMPPVHEKIGIFFSSTLQINP
jgi:hypothetical protein